MTKSLVIGGAGFVGSNLCLALLKKGHSVLSLDNYSTGSTKNHVNDGIYKSGNAQDINNYSMPIDLDYVFHLGEYSRVEQSVNEPFHSLNNICKTILPVIEFSKKTNAKLIYSGSSTKFGDAASPYSIGKQSNTWLVKNICEHLKIDYCITYFYNVYGPNEISDGAYSTVVAKFLKQKKLGQIALINAPGTQQRNFTHVNDIVSGIITVAEKGYGDLYGIGSDECYNIIELAKMIKLNYEIGEKVIGNRSKSKLMTEQTKKLGWSAQHCLKDYIFEALNDY